MIEEHISSLDITACNAGVNFFVSERTL